MKNLYKTILITLLSLCLSNCSNDDDCQGIDCLPPATQSGANNFGCLLDGEVFIPSGGVNPLDCVYQNISGERYFQLQGRKRDDQNNLISIAITSIEKELLAGEAYQLIEEENGNLTGRYGFRGDFSFTSSQYTGELFITHLNLDNQTISGTFWFDIIDQDGELREIREGRFDMPFTQ